MSGRWRTIDPLDLASIPCAPGCYVAEPVLREAGAKAVTLADIQHPVERAIGLGVADDDWQHPPGFTATPWGIFHNVRVKVRLAVKYGDWAMIELRLIRRLRPRFNSCVFAKRARREGGARA